MYSRHRILILDDVFSGLDAISEDRIFSRLFGKNGLLHQSGTTIILATHAAHRLPLADHIIALTSKGALSEQGRFQDLILGNGYVSGLVARHVSEVTEDKDVSPAKTKVPEDVRQQNAKADIKRPVGEWATYRFYFASLGWQNLGVWAVLLIFYSLLQQFPSTYPFLKLILGNMLNFGRSMDQVLDIADCSSWELCQWSVLGHTNCCGICSHWHAFHFIWYAIY